MPSLSFKSTGSYCPREAALLEGLKEAYEVENRWKKVGWNLGWVRRGGQEIGIEREDNE